MNITDALVAEHTIFLTVFDQIEGVLPSLITPAEVRTMASIIEGMLRVHAATEANLAYLALDHVLHEKGQLDRLYEDHHEIDSRLRKVHDTKTVTEARRLLKAALQTSREHFQYEERVIFPLLRATLQQETLNQLGEKWMARFPAMQPASAIEQPPVEPRRRQVFTP